MALDTLITPLNFNDGLIGKSFNDRKNGLDIILGYVSGMPPDLAEIAENHGGIGLALIDRGIGQHELDQACQSLAEQCLNQDFSLLITKSDLPFDARWYLIGDLISMLDAAARDRISLPFSDFLYDELSDYLRNYMD
ncbi:MAG: hypothetical protein H6861_06670 [Rhodospirillales bacterium]|nr:hypothetical protein [Rhodospirillales bacterium]